MKNLIKSNKGITLIALVITIIVLLILAGVTIAMLSGENGILSRATETRGTNAYYSAEEQARLAYMTVKTEIMANRASNGTYSAAGDAENLKNMVKSELVKAGSGFEVSAPTESNTKIKIRYSNTSLKKDGISTGVPAENGHVNYVIILSNKEATLEANKTDTEFGEFTADTGSGGSGGSDPVDPTQTGTSVTELREGQEVVYTDQDGNEIPCIVLYDSTGSYGIQVISKDTVGSNIELGNGTGNTSYSTDSTHFATAKASYNTAIATLNSTAQNYMNTNLSPANGARCVGSSPSETPITSEDNTGTYTNNNNYFKTPTDYNNQFKVSSANNTSSTNEDWLKMNTLGCYNISQIYWLASRRVYAQYNFTSFELCNVYSNGNFVGNDLCRVGTDGYASSISRSYGLRPVFTLKSNIHYTDDGTKKMLVQ